VHRVHRCLGWRGLLCLAALGLPLCAPADPRDELKALRERIDGLQRELARNEEDRSDAADALRESERAISTANRRLFELTAQQKALSVRLSGLQTEHDRLFTRIQQQRQAVGAVLRAAHLRGAAASVPLLLSGEEPERMARALHYLGYVSRAHIALVEALRRDLAALDALAQRTRAQTAELAGLEAQQSAQRADLLRQKGARNAALARVAADVQRQRREIGALRRDEARLARLVQRLAEEIAARPARRPVEAHPGQRAGKAAEAAGNFGRLRGRLRLPTRGELANRFGSPREDTGTRWNGVFFRTAPGAAVQAVAAGQVVFADWLRGYGNLLIVDHGDGYMTLYANNESLLREVGTPVLAGEPLAAAGSSGGNTQTGLYFEVRHRGRPLDPLQWMRDR
jgi:murein hydrolase activator